MRAAWVLVSAVVTFFLAAVAAEEPECAQENKDEKDKENELDWQPWDDGEWVALDAVFASDAEEESCPLWISVGERVALDEAIKALRTQMQSREKDAEIWEEKEAVYVALNGAVEGVWLTVESRRAKENCLGSLAAVAYKGLVEEKFSDAFEPMRLLSNTGRPIRSWNDVVRSDFIIHLLLDRQAWHWPGVRVGFSFQVSGVKLTTVAMSPKVILAENVVTQEEADRIIASGSQNLYSSPEKHYSDDSRFKNYRTSETGSLSDQNPDCYKLRRKAQQVLRLHDLSFVEPLQLLRYQPGKWYKEHYDVFHGAERLAAIDEESSILTIPPELCQWAEQQRHLLWRLYNQQFERDLSSVENLGARLFTRPQADWYPAVRTGTLLKNLASHFGFKTIGAFLADYGDIVDIHVVWLQKVFCSADVSDQCPINAAEMLDNVTEAFPTIPSRKFLHRNRHVTMLPYLTKVEEGGETVFPYSRGKSLFGPASNIRREGMNECSRGIFVPPIPLGAAIFYHLTPDLTMIDKESMHGGCPPVVGLKYAINIFCWNIDWELGLAHVNSRN